ncbi:hypothetical protein [Aquitalea sp. LB_tupeE]|uniref:hypothetical protein n=1 Tax=Aquitalea sp. LB_tupeE TaxID=2748078 RepID=UPI0015BC2143|nr:hypothetical protein [Aquitalea sp. LB_tupeE]NWK79754.1 hypothetical protein [Aquitalea sp. LB_tupeE]
MSDLQYVFSDDKQHLAEYVYLRKRQAVNVHNVDFYTDDEVEAGKDGDVLIISSNGQCVGGVIILFEEHGGGLDVLQKFGGCDIRSQLVEHEFGESVYAQLKGLSLSPGYGGMDVLRRVFSILIERALKNNVNVLFAMTPVVNARLYRMCFKRMGYVDMKMSDALEKIPRGNFDGELDTCVFSLRI